MKTFEIFNKIFIMKTIKYTKVSYQLKSYEEQNKYFTKKNNV